MTKLNFWKRPLAVLTLAGLVVGGASASAMAQSIAEIESRGTIHIGVLQDFPPFGSIDTSGQTIGYDPDLAKAYADSLGVELNIVPVTSANRVQYLLAGQVDVLFASLGITEERAKVVDFSIPYAGLQQFVYGDKNVEVAGPDDLAGQTIAVTRGTTQDIGVTNVAPPTATIQRYDEDASSVQALLSGQAPLIGLSNIAIDQVEKQAPDRFDIKFKLSEQVQGIAVRKDAAELLGNIDDFLRAKLADGSLAELHQQWMPGQLPDAVFKQ